MRPWGRGGCLLLEQLAEEPIADRARPLQWNLSYFTSGVVATTERSDLILFLKKNIGKQGPRNDGKLATGE